MRNQNRSNLSNWTVRGVIGAVALLMLSTPSAVAAGVNNDQGRGRGLAAVEIRPYLKPPTGISLTQPLTNCPIAARTVVADEGPNPEAIAHNDEFVRAAQSLGWTVIRNRVPPGPGGANIALDAALDMTPDAVLVFGPPSSALQPQLARATSLGIPVLLSDNGDPAGTTGTATTVDIQGKAQTGLWGKLIGDFAAAQGADHALVVDMSAFPTLHAYSQSVVHELDRFRVDSTVIDVTATELVGGAVPGRIVAALQTQPDIDWVLLALGDFTIGLKPALDAAGLTARVKVAGEGPKPSNLQALRTGTEAAWVGFPNGIVGSFRADAMARLLTGEDPTTINYVTPTQLLTPDNIENAPLDSRGEWVGVPGFEDLFQQLWKVNC
jgi:ABC-type sugar transport system substrate-binding protein